METITSSTTSHWSLLNFACNLAAGVPAIVPLWLACHWAANRWLRRASAIRGEWIISALATLTPTLLLFLLSG